jgi:hypothetical protein
MDTTEQQEASTAGDGSRGGIAAVSISVVPLAPNALAGATAGGRGSACHERLAPCKHDQRRDNTAAHTLLRSLRVSAPRQCQGTCSGAQPTPAAGERSPQASPLHSCKPTAARGWTRGTHTQRCENSVSTQFMARASRGFLQDDYHFGDGGVSCAQQWLHPRVHTQRTPVLWRSKRAAGAAVVRRDTWRPVLKTGPVQWIASIVGAAKPRRAGSSALHTLPAFSVQQECFIRMRSGAEARLPQGTLLTPWDEFVSAHAVPVLICHPNPPVQLVCKNKAVPGLKGLGPAPDRTPA